MLIQCIFILKIIYEGDKVEDIQIKSAQSSDKEGGRLTHLAIDEMAQVILGETSNERLNKQLQQLWQKKGNRFSHDISYVERRGTSFRCYNLYLISQIRKINVSNCA